MRLKAFNIYKFAKLTSHLQSVSGATNYMKLLKLLFFIDRYHIRHFGSLATFDQYYALRFGPVGSESKDILTLSSYYYDNLKEDDSNFLRSVIKPISNYEIDVKYDDKDISESRIEAIDFVVKKFNSFDQYQLADISHDYPEWKRYKDLFENEETTQENILLEDFFSDPDISNSPYITKYLKHDPFEDDREFLNLLKEDVLGNSASCQ